MRVTLLAVVLVAAMAGRAAANPYEAFIDVDSEDDLYDLQASQQISDDTFNVLLDLIERGVDLNLAGREELYSLPNLTYDDVDAILAYRKEQKFIKDPADLVGAGVLTQEKLLAISAFLIVRDPFAGLHNVHGFVEAQTRFTVGDDVAPPVGLRARAQSGHWTAGLVASETRLRTGDVVYDPDRAALIVDAPGVQAHVPKAYIAYDDDQFAAIAGSFRIGFAERLTFDDSSDYTPNGIYRDDQLFRDETLGRECNESAGELGASPCATDFHYVTPDFRWREAMLGVAAGAKRIPVGNGWLQAYAWGSLQPHSIYQYELYDPSICADPRNDADPRCAAPQILIRPDGDRLNSAAALAFSTLPNMYGEALVGANATYYASRRTHLGLTTYGARDTWYTSGQPLDFQEWSSRPSGGAFGAVGLDASAGVGSWDLATEVTESFDQMKPTDPTAPAHGGGGPAAVVRATWTVPHRRELELTARYLDTQFLNPYARPISEPDQFEGQSARDEEGVRARYTERLNKQVALRGSLDFWRSPSDGTPQVAALARTDVVATRTIGWGAWVEFNDKDLRGGGRGSCYDQPYQFDEFGEPINCKGLRLKTTGRLLYTPRRDLQLAVQLQHSLQDDTAFPTGFRQDVQAWATAAWQANDRLRLRGRVRYLDQDISSNTSLERSLWTYVEAAIKLRGKDRLSIRNDVYWWLDQRARTLVRTPQPEVRFWATYEARY